MSQTMVKLEREGERERGMGEGGEREGRRVRRARMREERKMY